MKQLVKKVLKGTKKEGSKTKFFNINPIKNAKSKLSKTINRKARRAQRFISSNDVGLATYKINKNAKTTGELKNSKSRRGAAKMFSLQQQKEVHQAKKDIAKNLVGGAAMLGASHVAKKLRTRNDKKGEK